MSIMSLVFQMYYIHCIHVEVFLESSQSIRHKIPFQSFTPFMASVIIIIIILSSFPGKAILIGLEEGISWYSPRDGLMRRECLRDFPRPLRSTSGPGKSFRSREICRASGRVSKYLPRFGGARILLKMRMSFADHSGCKLLQSNTGFFIWCPADAGGPSKWNINCNMYLYLPVDINTILNMTYVYILGWIVLLPGLAW